METTTLIADPSAERGFHAAGPFDLADNAAYLRWRDAKLAGYPASAQDLIVPISDLGDPGQTERAILLDKCRKANMALYECHRAMTDGERARSRLLAFTRVMGLTRMEGHRSAAVDGIVALQVSEDQTRGGYIPYTDKPLSWHTDGYYNEPANTIRAFVLHCIREAADGGDSAFLDPEIAYIRLRDENPDFVAALMHSQAMTIPANIETDGKVRPESVGPVFSLDRTGALHMRYTARTRSIQWRDDPATKAAVKFLNDMLASEDPYIIRHKLAPGQGIICNNVLHCRARFQDDGAPSPENGRLLFRMRYLDRVNAAE